MACFRITKPEETEKEYYVRGLPNAIQRDLLDELKDMNAFHELSQDDLTDLEYTSYIISSALIISKAQSSTKEEIKYAQIDIIKNTPFTCDIKQVSLSLISQIVFAGLKIGVLPLLGPFGTYVEIAIGMFGLPGLRTALASIHRVTDSQFCVLMDALQKEPDTLFTSDDIYNELHDEEHNIICPYFYIYNKAYHNACPHLSPQGVCSLNKNDIYDILCNLAPGKKYGIEKLDANTFKRL